MVRETVFLDESLSKLDTALPHSGTVHFDLVQFDLVIHLRRKIRKTEGVGGWEGREGDEANEAKEARSR